MVKFSTNIETIPPLVLMVYQLHSLVPFISCDSCDIVQFTLHSTVPLTVNPYTKYVSPKKIYQKQVTPN